MAKVELSSVSPRSLTWAEKEYRSLQEARKPGLLTSVIDNLPDQFWEALVLATDYYVLEVTRPPSHEDANQWRELWKRWEKKFVWHTGIGPLKDQPWNEYQLLIREGRTSSANLPDAHIAGQIASPAIRLAAFEVLLEVAKPHPSFASELNSRLTFLDAGLRLVGKRLVAYDSIPMHENVVEPAAELLSDPEFESAEELFIEATDRARSGDYPGCVTACWRATEEALHCLGSSLDDLGNRVRANQGITPAIGELLNRLQTLRYETGAGAGGAPIDLATAQLAIQVSGALITYLAKKI